MIFIIRIVLIMLFVYAGLSKIIDVEHFQEQLFQSPIIPASVVPMISYLLPTGEIVLSILLSLDKFLKPALILSFAVMLFFSFYLIGLVSFFTNVPCACGGILGNMGYPAHIIFNVVMAILPVWAVFKIEREEIY